MRTFIARIMKIVDSITHWVQRVFARIGRGLRNPKERTLIIRDFILVSIVIFIFLSSLFFLWASSLKTPDLQSFDDRLLGQSAKIYDRTGTVLLYDLSQKVRRTTVPFENISQKVKEATLSIEDADFYNHGGVRASSIVRAILIDIVTLKFSQGGSTITQQVVKNSLLTTDKKISRKLKEWILAIKLEQMADKDSIFNLYLNETSYGGNIYGVEEASQLFFAKKTTDLTLAEAAYLAAIPQAPTFFSPYGKNKDKLVERKNLVLKKMLENKYINEDEYTEALNEQVVFQPRNLGSIKAPHFVMYIKEYLEQKYGERMLQDGGFKVITSLDYDLQKKAEDVVKNYVIKNEKTFKASNGALVATDPKTGQILAMVGSRDYFDKEIEGNFNVTTAHRQPGSSFKPFVYATAFNQGYTPETPIYDVPTEFNTGCNLFGQPVSAGAKCYSPQNYEGGYKGLMNLRSALGASRNVPAVRLLYLVGIDAAIQTARAMGIESLSSASQYGLSLVLGGGEVSLLDMTSAYGVFANDGIKNPKTGILHIETSKGTALEDYATSSSQVIPTQTARLMNEVLSDPRARNTIFTLRYTGERQVGIKTGTTNISRDAWILGYTPNLSVGAWMGNNDNTPMAQKASATIVAPMWKEFMDYALDKYPDQNFEKPEPIDSTLKPFLKGQWYGSNGEIHSELYWIDKNDPTGEPPANPAKDPQYPYWEYGVQNWAIGGGAATLPPGVGASTTLPFQPSPTNPTPVNTVFQIVSPITGSTLKKTERLNMAVRNAFSNTTRVEYYLNGTLVGTGSQSPFTFSVLLSDLSNLKDMNDLRAVAYDNAGGKFESSVLFKVE